MAIVPFKDLPVGTQTYQVKHAPNILMVFNCHGILVTAAQIDDFISAEAHEAYIWSRYLEDKCNEQ